MTGWRARWNQIAAGALCWKEAGTGPAAVRAPLSGPYPCGMIELVQQESLTERG